MNRHRTPAPRPPRRVWSALAVAAAALAGFAGVILLSRSFQPAHAGANASMDAMHDASTRTPNRLIKEKSPYLLQHAYNPVDWYPWGEEAFEKAKRENKPIFLSIGYSTCHWCHVMERESFENDSVAALLNRWFVSIKVDREERPDVDRLYMHAVQAMGAGGGWPLNVFLTPDRTPFYGGTYFPPDARQGRPGMMQLLPRIAEVWTEQRDAMENNGRRIFEAIASLSAPDSGATDRAPLFESAYAYLERGYDAQHGGFGASPKFPSTVNLSFLFRWWAADPEGRKPALDMALRQLDAMRAGGIHDHLGGGFHRYATDENWLVPHFEKMLYDQAQLAWAYLDAYQITRNEAYARTARGIFDYVARDLTSPGGAFYSAEDADSEGEEGTFYVWTPDQIRAVLGHDEGRLLEIYYGVTDRGNFEGGTSILSEVRPLEPLAMSLGYSPAHAARTLEEARAKLLDARSKRPRPHLDDKVLVSWNGLMISAYARGARVLGDPALATRAERAAEFVWKHLFDEKTGEMRRRWREGETAGKGQLDDYAYYALGCTDLYAATFDPVWLERAVRVTEAQIERFWDEADGGFFESPAGDPHVAIRMKDGFDGAEMAGNSIAALNLQALGTLLDREEWLTKARQTFDYFATRLSRAPAAMPQMLVAMDLEQATPRHVVIAGDPKDAGTRAMIDAFNRRFLPHDELLLVQRGASRKRMSALMPFTENLVPKDEKATAYVCVNYACKLPTTDPAAFAAQLDERPSAKAPR